MMKFLVFTHMYPSDQYPQYGVFVQHQVESLRRTRVETDVLFVNSKASRWKYLWSLFPFLKRVYSRKYDIIHALYVFAAIIARCQLRSPLVLTHHGGDDLMRLQKRLCWLISRLVDKVIVPTEERKEPIGLKKAVVSPCGFDFEIFKPVPRDFSCLSSRKHTNGRELARRNEIRNIAHRILTEYRNVLSSGS